MALGAILRAERERRGLTEHQVADATRMMVQMVRELEEEDFHRIAAPIYGRGFVKLYASHLELDPAPLVKEFDQLYAERGRQPPPPRVALQRFGDTPGASLERVAPPSPPAGESEPTPAPIRVPAPAAARAAQPIERPVAAPDTQPAATPSADLFGEPLPRAGRVSLPVIGEEPPPVASPKPAPFGAPRRASAAPELPEGLAEPTGGAPTMAEPVRRKTPLPTSAGQPTTPRSVLDSASHRFHGKPFRPGVGHRASFWIGRFVGWIATGVVAAGLGVAGAVRSLGRALRRGTGALGRGIRAGGARLGASAGQGARTLGGVSWGRIARIAGAVAAATLLVWAIVAGVRSCGRASASAPQNGAPGAEPAAVLERILPPPAGYAD